MRALVLLALLAAAPCFGQTGSATLSCTPPTQNTDGTPISGAVSYKFYRGTTATSQTTASPAQASCNYVWTGLSAGTHYFSATATVAGVESARSNVASKTIASTPSPPTNLAVQADNLVAYGLQQSATGDGSLTTYPVGVAAAGTPCNANTSVNGLYQIPKSSVAWAGDVRPAVVLAACSPSGG